MPQFSHDMLRDFRRIAPLVFKGLVGKPVQFLEVGTFEGQAACWMLENILTHKNSLYMGVEIDPERYEKTVANFRSNPDWEGKWVMVLSDSSRALLAFHPWFDGIYIDGDHRYEQASKDVFNGWDLLRVGGVMLVDDYALTHSSLDPSVEYGVKQAVDDLVKSLRQGSYEILLQEGSYQFAIRKVG